jgi:hypothetical protein
MNINQVKPTGAKRKADATKNRNRVKREKMAEIRTQAAIAAMAAMLLQGKSTRWSDNEIATDAVELADALMSELRRKSLR